MFRGRTPRKSAPISRACDFVESLEERRLLTTLQGGDVFNYLDEGGKTVQIRLEGTITAEFTALRNGTIGNLVPAGATAATGSTVTGANIFNIYIASAAPDSQIIITDYTAGPPIAYQPYGGGGTVNINPNIGTTTSFGLGQGGVYIGAQTPSTATVPNIPITSVAYGHSFGLLPRTRVVYAGIQTAATGVSLGKVLIGGTVTGIVNISGNVNEFYAGNILTGDTQGNVIGSKPVLTNNFQVGGDLRTLLVSGSVGTLAGEIGIYHTGTEFRVGGKLGYIHVGGDDSSSVQVVNGSTIAGITTPQAEAEYTLLPGQNVNDVFINGNLSGAFFTNDNTTANDVAPPVDNNYPFLNSYTSSTTGATQAAEVSGTLDGIHGDLTDTYNLALIAGQTVTLRLNSGETAQLGVFDPLGRLVSTDLADAGGEGPDQPFNVTATVPGVYRLVVADPQDDAFNGTGPIKSGAIYTLSATNIGELALGGIDVGGNYAMMEPGNGVAVARGDIGAIEAGGEVGAFSSTIGGIASPIAASRGNLRALYGGTIGSEAIGIGTEQANEELLGDLVIPRGSVGYIHSEGLLALNPGAIFTTGLGNLSSAAPIPSAAIGFDYQRVEAGGALDANLIANGDIGTIMAASVAQSKALFQPIFSANTDGKGEDGGIDTIYVTGNFGSTAIGGPALYAGIGGNIKYIHVGGTTYRDQFFGGSQLDTLTYPVGQSESFTDDSGAKITITPTTVVTATTLLEGALTANYYPVRDGGGVLISIASNTSLNASTTTGGGSFDIGQISVNSAGTTTTTTPGTGATTVTTGTGVTSDGTAAAFSATDNTTGFPVSGATTTTGTVTVTQPTVQNAIVLSGVSPINVMNITGDNVTSINNTTSGEISGVNVESLGYLTAQSAGFIKSTTDAEVDVPTNLSSSAFPYNPYSYGLEVTGTAVNVTVRDGLGSLHAGNAIGTVVANADGKNAKGILDGITGAIVGRVVQTVNVGEGVATTGTGEDGGAGIFATGADAEIQNVIGNNADIRGYIVSEARIDNIILNNGSLIGARVVTPTTIAQAAYNDRTTVVISQVGNVFEQTDTPGGTPVTPIISNATLAPYSVGTINVRGNGGILGSLIQVGNFDAISSTGFGIVSSAISTIASIAPDNILSAGGLGIRDSDIDVGSGINTINAVGSGQVLNVNNYDAGARQSVNGKKFDLSGTGRLLDASNDLNRALGTSRATPAISGITNSGLLVNDVVTGNGSVGTINAYLIGSTDVTDTPDSALFPMRIAVANSIGKVNATYVSGLYLTTGTLNKVTVTKTLGNATINTSDAIGSIAVGRDLLGSTTIESTGGEGVIGTISAGHTLDGTIVALGKISEIVGDNIGAILTTSSNLGVLEATGDLLPTADIRVRKTLGTLLVAGDVENGAVVQASSYGTKHVGGKIYGTIGTL